MSDRWKHRGAASELEAAVWLLGQGYEVFRNVSQHGDIDLVAIKGDEVLRVDVKTRNQIYRIPEPEGVSYLFRSDSAFVWNRDLPVIEGGQCGNCAVEITPARTGRVKKYCSDKCRQAAYGGRGAGQHADSRVRMSFVSSDPEEAALRGS